MSDTATNIPLTNITPTDTADVSSSSTTQGADIATNTGTNDTIGTNDTNTNTGIVTIPPDAKSGADFIAALESALAIGPSSFSGLLKDANFAGWFINKGYGVVSSYIDTINSEAIDAAEKYAKTQIELKNTKDKLNTVEKELQEKEEAYKRLETKRDNLVKNIDINTKKLRHMRTDEYLLEMITNVSKDETRLNKLLSGSLTTFNPLVTAYARLVSVSPTITTPSTPTITTPSTPTITTPTTGVVSTTDTNKPTIHTSRMDKKELMDAIKAICPEKAEEYGYYGAISLLGVIKKNYLDKVNLVQ